MEILEYIEVKPDVITGSSTRWKNKDLVPMPPYRRSWNYLTFTAFWSINNVCLSSWLGATSLLPLGLSVGNAMGVIAIGNVIITVCVISNGWIGAKYHIGYTISQRLVFGIYGSYIGITIRVVLSVVWFGSQAWLGGLCINVILSSWSHSYLTMKNTFPASVNMTSQELIGFVIFQIMSIPIACIRPEKVNVPAIFANVISFFAMLGLTIWACSENGGAGDLLHRPDTISGSQFAWAWVYGISSWFGSLVVGIANMSDFTRFSVSKQNFWPGTIVAIMIPGIIVPFFGVITASATSQLYNVSGDNIFWNPLTLITYWLQTNYTSRDRAAACILGLAFSISQLCQNTLANAFSGGMDLAGACPKFIDIRRGAIVTCLLSWVVQPWLFYNSSSTFLLVMSSFSVFLTPLLAIMICDFLIVRKRKIRLLDLFHSNRNGSYFFTGGFNLRAIIIWAVTFTIGLPGMISYINPSITTKQGLTNFYLGSFFFEFPMAFIMYYLACLTFPLNGAGEQDTTDYFGTFTAKDCVELGMIPLDEIENQNAFSPGDGEH